MQQYNSIMQNKEIICYVNFRFEGQPLTIPYA